MLVSGLLCFILFSLKSDLCSGPYRTTEPSSIDFVLWAGLGLRGLFLLRKLALLLTEDL